MEEGAERSSRARLVAALVLALGLGLAVVLIALRGPAAEETSGPAADAECVELWNSDPEAMRVGRHQYGAHGYTSLEVARLSEDGRSTAAGSGGVCAMVFPARSLDPEPPAAALGYLQGSWVPLSFLPTVSEARLAELQAAAYEAANATMRSDGSIASS